MIRSMTGYGQALISTHQYDITVEIKSVNHRFCEISVRTSREFISLEDPIKKKVTEQLKRGKVDIFITIERKGENTNKKLTVDWILASEYIQAHSAIAEKFNLPSAQLAPLDLVKLPEVIQLGTKMEDPAEITELVLDTTDRACRQLVLMRESEGLTLKQEISSRMNMILKQLSDIRERAPLVTEFYRERLTQRMKDFLTENLAVDEGKLMNEVALFSEKSNIDEELTRIGSHCQQFSNALMSVESVGRKLDFLLQEMNREVNTMGAKANDIEISQRVVDLKAELEKIKEQVQNIE